MLEFWKNSDGQPHQWGQVAERRIESSKDVSSSLWDVNYWRLRLIKHRMLKMKMQLFQQYFLSMQDKNMWDKITKIWKREMQTRFILIRSLLVPMSSPQVTPLEIFHYPCKSFTIFEHTLRSLILVFKFLTYQKTKQSLNYNWVL